MNAKVIPYEPVHALDIIDRNIREEDLWISGQDWEKAVHGWKKYGPAYTLVVDDQIVGCAGVVLMDWKRGEAWTLLSPLFYKHTKTFIKAVKKYLREIIEEHQLRRIQALVKPDFETAERFIKYMGFQYEGLMRAYGPKGEDLAMYSMVRG